MEMFRHGRSEELSEKPVELSVFQRNIPHGLVWNRSRQAFSVDEPATDCLRNGQGNFHLWTHISTSSWWAPILRSGQKICTNLRSQCKGQISYLYS